MQASGPFASGQNQETTKNGFHGRGRIGHEQVGCWGG